MLIEFKYAHWKYTKLHKCIFAIGDLEVGSDMILSWDREVCEWYVIIYVRLRD
jgi:hypothetical protein